LADAQQLIELVILVMFFEKRRKVGGLLRYGIPDFKMEKYLTEELMFKEEGIISRRDNIWYRYKAR